MLAASTSGDKERIGTFEALVAQPEQVEADLVAFEQFIVGEDVETLALLSFVTIFRVVAGDKIVEMCAGEGIGAQREVLVGAQIVDPQSLGPVVRAGRFLIEEQHIGFDALGIENTGR